MNLITDRLLITEFTEDMALRVYENSLDADTARYVPDEVYGSVQEAREALRFLISRYESASGPFVYPFLLKGGENIGYVQAVRIPEGWEIGFQIAERFSGKGYTTEALKAFLPAILGKLGLSTVFGICLADNIGSQRVLEKCGFTSVFEGVSNYQGEERRIKRYVYRDLLEQGHENSGLTDLETVSTWKVMPGAPVRNTQGGWVLCNGFFYSIGGRSDRVPSLENFRYNPAAGQWLRRAPMKEKHANGAYVSAKGRIHVIGGDPFSDLHEVYDPLTDRWSQLAPVPAGVQHAAGVVVRDKIYVMGGLESWHKVSDQNRVYDIRSDSWTEMAPMPIGKHGYSPIVHDGRIYIFGSLAQDSAGTAGVYGSERSVEVYDIESDKWECAGIMPADLYLGAAALYKDEVIIVGGFRDGDEIVASVDFYSLKTREWRSGPPLPKAFVGMGALVNGDNLYVSGGADPSENWLGNRDLFKFILR